MAAAVRMKPEVEKKLIEVLLDLAKERPLDGKPFGYAQFMNKDVLEKTGDVIKNKSYISVFLKQFQAQKRITLLRRGAQGSPSQWDLRRLLKEVQKHEAEVSATVEVVSVKKPEVPETVEATKQDGPEISFEVVKQEETQEETEEVVNEQQEVVVPQEEVVVQVEEVKPSQEEVVKNIHQAIAEMTEYLKVLPNQMITHLNALAKDIDPAPKEKIKEYQEQIDSLKGQLSEAIKNGQSLSYDLAIKEKQLAQRKEVQINKNAVIRYKHHIMDDVERFIAAAGWQRENMKDGFRTKVTQKLNEIMVEVGIGENNNA